MRFETSGRRQVEKRAASLRRGWLRRRDIKARDLHPAASDLLSEWSEARARLELGDERGEWGDRWQIAAQNSVARLAGRLEDAAVVERDPAEELRELLRTADNSEAWAAEEALLPASGNDGETFQDEDEPEALEDDSLSIDEVMARIEDSPPPLEPAPVPKRPKPWTPADPRAWRSQSSRTSFVDTDLW